MKKNDLIFDLESLERRQMLTTIDMFVAGSTGQENFDLQIDGQTVASFTNVDQTQRVFTYDTDAKLTADNVRIAFTNDAGFSGPTDRNLVVDRIRVDGVTYQTENASTFSTGTWRAQDGVTSGTGRGDTLHTNGFFQFSNNGQSFDGSQIQVNARGTSGNEILSVKVNGEQIAKFQVTDQAETYTLGYRRTINPTVDTVRVEFTNDAVNSDLIVDNIRVDGTTFQSESAFSTGTWVNNRITPGYWNTEFLHSNGFFEYNTVAGAPSTITVHAGANSPEAQMRVTVCLLYTSPSPRDKRQSRMPSSA